MPRTIEEINTAKPRQDAVRFHVQDLLRRFSSDKEMLEWIKADLDRQYAQIEAAQQIVKDERASWRLDEALTKVDEAAGEVNGAAAKAA